MSLDDTIACLDRDGFVILESLLDAATLRELEAELAPHEAARPRGRNSFEGERSTRVYSLAGKGEPFLRLAEHPRVVEVLDRLLLPNWLLSTFQSIRLHPGETEQPWHADDNFYLVPDPRPRLALSCIWAIEDFTDDNGATELIPGSHLPSSHLAGAPSREPVRATMPAGSVVLFDGRLQHRGGANRSTRTRLAISPQYCEPWLRTQESQLLIVPPEKAATCTPRQRAMLGYSIHPPFIGQVEGMHPIRLVDPSYSSARTSEAAQLADRVLVPR
ncbi:MAG: phytanoyl-CoA dioxygenase family protein [Myxococcota bacterium]|nr:phytanoyl-CoA dioxygenase family protein [Myxococcota bacterium]